MMVMNREMKLLPVETARVKPINTEWKIIPASRISNTEFLSCCSVCINLSLNRRWINMMVSKMCAISVTMIVTMDMYMGLCFSAIL